MRYFSFFLILFLSAPALSQPVLTIIDARKANPVAAYGYFLEDLTHKLTYGQVSNFPLDSFKHFSRTDVVQLGYRRGTVWMRFSVKNQTNADLFLISCYRHYDQFTVFVKDAHHATNITKSGYSSEITKQQVPTVPLVVPLGNCPKTVTIQLSSIDGIGDYLHIGGVGQAVLYQKQMIRWQSLALGAYGVVFLFALLFFGRLRDPLIGWYSLLMFSIIIFYVSFYGYLGEYIDFKWWRHYIPVNLFYVVCWSLFHVHFLNLKYYSKILYWAITGLNMAAITDHLLSAIISRLSGHYVSIMDEVLYWLGLDGAGHTLIVLSLLLVSLIWVSIKNFRNVYLYAIAFTSSLLTMIIAILALYDLEWLPYKPYNDLFVPGTLIEIIMLGYILGDRANEHRRQQVHTQQQLIDQLQENLRQKAKLLQIRDEIARDLHDEMGATLTSIAISTKLAQKKINGQQPEITPILERIQTDSEETIHSLRNTVWALNPDNDAPEKLIERMRAAGCQLLTNQGISLAFESNLAPDTLPLFSMEQRRNVYFVFREAIHNVAKHAQATHVAVRIFRQSGEWHIRIADNGIGFEPMQTNDGNGLSNFQKRACEGGFSVDVGSEAGKGTTVEMRIPALETTHIGG